LSAQVRLRVNCDDADLAAPAAAAQAAALHTECGGFIDSRLVRTLGTLCHSRAHHALHRM